MIKHIVLPFLVRRVTVVAYLPAGLLPDPVLPPWTEQSLTGPRPCPESCDHGCALPTVQRRPWWTPAFTFSSGEEKNKKNEKSRIGTLAFSFSSGEDINGKKQDKSKQLREKFLRPPV